MATLIWKSVTGDFTAAASWGLSTTGADQAPAASDTLIFPATNAVAPSSNMAGLTGSLITEINIQPGFTPNIGGSGNPLTCTVTTLRHFGDGTLYFSDSSTSGDTDTIIINSNNLSNAAEITGTGPIARLVVVKGKVTVLGSLGAGSITTLEIHHRGNPGNDAQVVVNAPAGTARTITTLLMSGGVVAINQPITTAIVSAGQLTQDIQAIATLQLGGGTVLYNTPYNGTTGALTTANLLGGLLDLSRTGSPKLITTLKRFSSGRFARTKSIHVVTNDLDTTGGGEASSGGGGPSLP